MGSKGFTIPFVIVACLVILNGCAGEDSAAQGADVPGTGFSQVPGFNGVVRGIVPVGDGTGDIYVAGDFTSYRGMAANRIVHLHTSGTIAETFGEGFDDRVMGITLAKDGSGDLYAVGEFMHYRGQAAPRVARVTRDGALHPDFHPGTGFNFNPLTLLADQGGALYVAGNFTSFDGIATNRLARINGDGSLDQDFVVGTVVDSVRSIALAPDGSGKLYVGGGSLVRLNPDGSPDSTFVIGSGIPAVSSTPPVQVVVPAGDGSQDIYVGGQITSYNNQTVRSGLIRIDHMGKLVSTFDPAVSLIVFSVAPSHDGTTLYVAGNETPTLQSRFVRLNRNDGSVVAGFAEPMGLDLPIITIALVSDGTHDLYAGGQFTFYNGIEVNRLVRVTEDGLLLEPAQQ